MGCNYKNWAVTIKNAPNTKLVYKILFMDFGNLEFNCCARNVSLDFYVIQIYI